MKKNLITSVVAATALFSGSASAVTIFFSATSSPDGVTLDGGGSSGRVVMVSTSLNLSGSAPAAFGDILANGGTSGDFDSALGTLLGSPSAASPGIVNTIVYTDGFTFASPLELGDVGNNTYIFVVDEAGGVVNGIGAYQGTPVVPVGAASVVPSTDTPIIGGSNNGFQLAAVVPEPSVALLGAFGVFGLLRRRR